jgi:Golgi apparatus protein 1
VLRCLTERKEEIKNEACQREVLYFEKMEVSNFNNDVILAAACREDVQTHCKDVNAGGMSVFACDYVGKGGPWTSGTGPRWR